ncbi:MAG: chromosomal replication initiator protein DnaA [Chloroflexi bacterium]|nr:chromosomal replication initiator protein DnaA [Chloroflexota bacterium]
MLTQRTWEAALGALQVEVPKADYAAWFRDARFVRAGSREIVVAVPTVFAKEIVTRRYREMVARAVSKAHGGDVDVTFVVEAERPAGPPAWLADPPPAAVPVAGEAGANGARLNPRYSFDRFMVGSSNRLAHAAALRVSERPGSVYNPLFLYSGVGLGKTHLLHAIGRAVLAQRPETRMRYVPCETFVNDLLHAIRTEGRGDRRRRFRERYRTVDLLMVDDVEFLSRTEASQEEMFHTFNAIYEAGGQIVLTSDRPPREIARLEARLRSRFEVGLVADIQAPDLDLRRMILHQHAAAAGSSVSEDVVDLLADRITRNVRELEGALTRTLIYAELHGLPLQPATAEQALSGLGRAAADRPPASDAILAATAQHFDIDRHDLLGKRRDARTAGVRQVAMYLMRNDGRETLPEIGRVLGGRDHTTVLHGCNKIERRLKLEDQLKADIEAIRAHLAA